MRILTYLGFTLVSVLMQFCVMDFIQTLNQQGSMMDVNVSSHRKLQNNGVERLNALYYRKKINKEMDTLKNIAQLTDSNYDNTSITESYVTTDSMSTTIDVLYYEERVSTTENINLSTETVNATTEYDNVTEIALFENKNITKPNIVPSNTLHKSNENCDCNLFFKHCDINCCCDADCTPDEINIFYNCNETAKRSHRLNFCPLQTFYLGQNNLDYGNSVNSFENLFCVINSNIPKKQKVTQTYDTSIVNMIRDNSYKWESNINSNIQEFVNKPYTFGDYLWLLKNGSIYYIDIPSPKINNYCSGRAPVKFLKDKNVKCNVKLNDLEMIRILEATHDTQIITAKNRTISSSTMNCTTLHCTNWTILACDDELCVEYNKSVHEPSCTDHFCTNLALKVEYVFNNYNNTIINATIKFYMKTMSIVPTFMSQEISIRFVLGKNSVNDIIRLSGNPGYIYDLPVIASFVEGNHSATFFNNSQHGANFLPRLDNDNGVCKFSKNLDSGYIKFGSNTRTNCKILVKHQISSNNDTCKILQQHINEYLGLNKQSFVSPYGNPHNVKDDDWIPLVYETNLKYVQYKEYNEKTKKLHCYNLITRISFTFTYADVNELETKKYKIITTKIDMSARNLTFDNDNMSIVLTFDTNFLDVTNHPVYEYAGPPHLNIYLPVDFFSPFTYNGSIVLCYNILSVLICLMLLILK